MKGGGPTVSARAPTPSCSTTTCKLGRARLGRHRPGGPGRQHPARLLQGRGEDGRDLRDRRRRQALLDPRRLRHGRGRRPHHAARPRLGVHQHRRREGLPRRGRVGAQGPPRRVRRHRRRRPRRAVGPAGHRRRRSSARATTSTPTDLDRHAREHLAGYKVPRVAAAGRRGPPLAQRQARLPVGPRARRQAENSDRHDRHQLPTDLRLVLHRRQVGRRRPAPTRIDVISPSTEEVIGRGARRRPPPTSTTPSPRPARPFDHGPWPRMAPAERADIMASVSAAITARMDEFATPHLQRERRARTTSRSWARCSPPPPCSTTSPA